jgi:hypothetical protein
MAWQGDPNNKVPNTGQFDTHLSDAKKSVNRAQQVRRDNDDQKDITIRLLDIDSAIMRQLQKFQLGVQDNGERINVPIIYGSPEKWKSIQRDGFMRDYQGKIILPALAFQRTTTESNPSIVMFNRYLKYTVMKKYSEKNRYTQFSTLVGKNVPVNNVYSVTMPNHIIVTYHCIAWTEYVEQMNYLVERLCFETHDYWGEKHGFRFFTFTDNFSHTTQVQTDQDRMVKTEFDLNVRCYILPDVITSFDGIKDTTEKSFTAKKVIVQERVVPKDFNLDSVDDDGFDVRERWRNPNYPNIPFDEPIPLAPVVIESSLSSDNSVAEPFNPPQPSPAPTSSIQDWERESADWENDIDNWENA